MADEFRALGLADPAAVLGGKPAPDQGFEIWPDNAPVIQAFCSLSTQWRLLAGISGAMYQGLDYQAIPVVLRLLNLPDTPDLFNDLRAMELAALPILNS